MTRDDWGSAAFFQRERTFEGVLKNCFFSFLSQRRRIGMWRLFSWRGRGRGFEPGTEKVFTILAPSISFCDCNPRPSSQQRIRVIRKRMHLVALQTSNWTWTRGPRSRTKQWKLSKSKAAKCQEAEPPERKRQTLVEGWVRLHHRWQVLRHPCRHRRLRRHPRKVCQSGLRMTSAVGSRMKGSLSSGPFWSHTNPLASIFSCWTV